MDPRILLLPAVDSLDWGMNVVLTCLICAAVVTNWDIPRYFQSRSSDFLRNGSLCSDLLTFIRIIILWVWKCLQRLLPPLIGHVISTSREGSFCLVYGNSARRHRATQHNDFTTTKHYHNCGAGMLLLLSRMPSTLQCGTYFTLNSVLYELLREYKLDLFARVATTTKSKVLGHWSQQSKWWELGFAPPSLYLIWTLVCYLCFAP